MNTSKEIRKRILYRGNRKKLAFSVIGGTILLGGVACAIALPLTYCNPHSKEIIDESHLNFSSDDTTIVGFIGAYDISWGTRLVIPATHNGTTVTTIADYAFEGCAGLTSLDLSSFNGAIGAFVFAQCTGITSLDLSNFTGVINYGTFLDCTSLNITNVTLPTSNPNYTSLVSDGNYKILIDTTTKEVIGSLAFGEVNSDVLAAMSMTSAIADYAFEGCTGLTSLDLSNFTGTIGSEAFALCAGINGTLTIPSTITSIGYAAFADCTGLTGTLTIPSTIPSIDDYTFMRCIGLASLDLSNFTGTIGGEAFALCAGINGTLTIPSTITFIGEQAFAGCTGITSLDLSSFSGSIGFCAFAAVSITSLDLSSFSGTIGFGTFSGCTSLNITNVTLPTSNPNYTSLVSDGNYKILIDTTTKEVIGSLAFGEVNSDVLAAMSMTSAIADYAFEGCTGLTSLDLSNFTGTIGSEAFFMCSSLTLDNITLPTSNPNYTSLVSDGNYKILIDTTTKEVIASLAFGEVNSDVLSAMNMTSAIVGGAFDGCTSLTSLDLSNFTGTIGNNAFALCTGISSLTIPSTVASIEDDAFWGCSGIISLNLSNFTGTIGSGAFASCSSIIMLTIPSAITTISSYTFEECTSLTSVTFNSILTSVGEGAFENCLNVTSFTFATNQTTTGLTIHEFAFSGCASSGRVYGGISNKADILHSMKNDGGLPTGWKAG